MAITSLTRCATDAAASLPSTVTMRRVEPCWLTGSIHNSATPLRVIGLQATPARQIRSAMKRFAGVRLFYHFRGYFDAENSAT